MYGTARGTPYGYSLWEFEVYGESGSSPTDTPVPPTDTPVPPTNTPAPTNTPTGGSGAFQESGGMVVMEAENYHTNVGGSGSYSSYDWDEQTSTSGYSGDGYMQALPNNGVNSQDSTDAPVMEYEVDFSSSGTYTVWVRRVGTSGSDDSCKTSVDGGGVYQWHYGQSSGWEWSKSPQTYSISSGSHTVNVWMREDGARVDKIVLTTDSGYTPSGTGPAESPRGGSSPTATPTGGSSLLENGDFENGTTDWAPLGSCSIAAESSIVYAGSGSVRAYNRTSDWMGPYQDVTSDLLANGQGSYTFSGAFRMASGSATAAMTIEVTDGAGQHWESYSCSGVGTSWVYCSGSDNVTWSGTLEQARLYLSTPGNATVTFYADEASLTKD
jgi:hypothetical protein